MFIYFEYGLGTQIVMGKGVTSMGKLFQTFSLFMQMQQM